MSAEMGSKTTGKVQDALNVCEESIHALISGGQGPFF